MRSDVAWWTEKKIEYYERASHASSFHRTLASIIEKNIRKDDSIIELGAGLGYVTEFLYNSGHAIKAYDSCPNAVGFANKRAGFDLITLSDAYDIRDKADVVLMLFFGSIRDEKSLDYFMNLADKKVIYAISRHKGNPYSERKDRRDEIASLLNECKVKFSIIDTSLNFDQPLKEEEVKEYFSISYGNDRIPALEKNDDENYPLFFRNRKEISIFIIEKEA